MKPFAALCLLSFAFADAALAAGPDVSARLVAVGNPTKARWPNGKLVYARNPWSVRAWKGKLYVGSGNSNNKGPAPNVGPIDLWAFDPKSSHWAKEFEIDDEQVDELLVLADGNLWIPGHDSHETGRNPGWAKVHNPLNIGKDWAFGNVYRSAGGGRWVKQRTVKNAIHTYDLIELDKKLFAACSTVAGGVVARSEDGGVTWRESLTSAGPWQRTRSLFALGGKLYAATSKGRLYRYDGNKKFELLKVDPFPGLKNEADVWVERPTTFADHAVYIGAKKIYDHDWHSFGLYQLKHDSKSLQAAPIALAEHAVPHDLFARNGKLYVLASSGSGKAIVTHVFSTSDLKSWTEELRFTRPTFARSFDQLDGAFYFGLGSDPDALSEETGEILKLQN